MKVKLLVDTQTLANGFVRVGDVIDVDDATAERWLDHRIAEFATSESEEVTNEPTEELTTSPVPELKKAGRPHKVKK